MMALRALFRRHPIWPLAAVWAVWLAANLVPMGFAPKGKGMGTASTEPPTTTSTTTTTTTPALTTRALTTNHYGTPGKHRAE